MGERVRRPEDMATTSTAVATTVTPTQKLAQIAKYSSKTGLLNDVNVLDLTRVVAGPFCTMTLGDLGANVIKIESFDGDMARKWGPPFISKGHKDSYYFLSVNRNKQSVCVDLKTFEGKKIINDLTQKCDVLVENYIPGKLDEMKIGYQALSKVNPRLIYCAITGFGPTGPYAKKPGYDVIAAAMGGLINSTGEDNRSPVKPAVPLTDICTGLHAFGAIMTALYHRQKTGKGQKIDCNLLSTQINVMINIATTYLNCGIEPKRWGTAHSSIVPYQAFKVKDGYLVVGTGSEAQFKDMCTRIGKTEWITDKRFKSNSDRVKNREVLIAAINEVMVTKTKKEWIKIFETATFPNGPVNTMEEVFDDDHVKNIGLVQTLDHPDAGQIKLAGPPTVYSEGENSIRTPPPVLGQHTRTVLSEFLGYSDTRIDDLFQNKVVK